MPSVNHRELLVCLLARQHQLLSDDELEQTLRAWLAAPERSLWELVIERAQPSTAQMSLLQATLDRQARETCAEPLAVRFRLLPPRLRELLAPWLPTTVADDTQATRRGGSTRPAPASAAPADAPPAPEGLAAAERFDILQVHAQGGLGVVFLARDREIDRNVALKQIKATWADDADARARFLLEARVTGRLEHPGVVPIYALGADPSGRPFYAMRLIRGESLLDVLERFHRHRAGQLAPHERVAELRKLIARLVDVCNAMDYAHNKGVLHRDLKPSNIMIGKYGETLVVDWGLAKVIGAGEDVALTTRMAPQLGSVSDSSATQLGSAIGTPAYMSPEQAAGKHDELTAATDVYSLGATLYHLLTGWYPRAVDGDPGIMLACAESGAVVPPRRRAPWLPKPLAAICMKALQPQPADRYRSCQALAADLEQWLAGEPVDAYAETWSERAFRWMRDHRTFVVSFLAVDFVATAAIVAGVLGWNHLQGERRKLELANQKQSEQIRDREQEQRQSLAAAAEAAWQSAAAELRADRYEAALTLLDGAVARLRDVPQLAGQRERIDARRNMLRQLATFRRAGDLAEQETYFQRDAEARRAAYEALTALGVFERGDWWDGLGGEGLSAPQRDRLQRDVYRKLVLLAALHGKETTQNLLSARGAAAARHLLAINERVQRFRPAEATRWHAATARLRLGEGAPLSVADLAPPQNGADAYMLGALWSLAAHNEPLRAMFAPGDRDPFQAAQQNLRLAEELAPDEYWTVFLRAFVELRQAGDPLVVPAAQSQPFYERAREALSHALAINPDYWLAYAERSGACRQEIESRRRAGDPPLAGAAPLDELQRLMTRDAALALNLAPPQSEALWYVGFALVTAGQTDQAIETLLAAVQRARRYDVESAPPLFDVERQRALPALQALADEALAADPADLRWRLLRSAVHLRQDDLAAADAELAQACAATPIPPLALALRGELRRRRGDVAAAASDLEAAVTQLPDAAPAWIDLGACRESQQQWAPALAAFESAAKVAAAPFARAAAEAGRCRVLSRLGQREEALAAARQALAVKPSCQVTALTAGASDVDDEQLTGKIERLARPLGATDLLTERGREFRTLPILDGGFELGLSAPWNNDDRGGLAWHNLPGCRSVGESARGASRSGERSLRVRLDQPPAPGSYGVTSQTVPADPQARYRLTVQVKAEDLAADAVALVLDDQLAAPVATLPPGTYGWQELTGQFDLRDSPAPVREGLKPLTLRIVCRGVGQAWLDDLRIEQVREPSSTDAQ